MVRPLTQAGCETSAHCPQPRADNRGHHNQQRRKAAQGHARVGAGGRMYDQQRDAVDHAADETPGQTPPRPHHSRRR